MSRYKKQQNPYYQGDLIFIFGVFLIISVAAIYAAGQFGQYGDSAWMKQVLFYIVGAGLIGLLLYFDLEQLEKLSLYVLIAGVLSLLLLRVAPESIAPIKNGAKSWFQIGNFTLQPSEFTKIGIMMMVASIISKAGPKDQRSLREDVNLLLKIAAWTVIPIGMIVLQDAGTGAICLFIVMVMVFMSGVNWKLITIIGGSAALVLGLFLVLVIEFPHVANSIGIADYQINRITSWMSDSSAATTQAESDKSWQVDQAVMAIGSGGITGNGVHNLKVYVPEGQTDFIFAILGESFGFLGCAIVVVMFFFLIYRLVVLIDRLHAFNRFGAFFLRRIYCTYRDSHLPEHRDEYRHYAGYRYSAAVCQLWGELGAFYINQLRDRI